MILLVMILKCLLGFYCLIERVGVCVLYRGMGRYSIEDRESSKGLEYRMERGVMG